MADCSGVMRLTTTSRQIALQTDNIMSLLQPGAQLIIEVIFRLYIDVVGTPPRAIVVRLNDARTLKPTVQGKTGQETVLARRETCEPNTCDADQACFLRDNLNVSQRM